MQHVVERWNEVVRHGVLPQWSETKPSRQPLRPQNHGSINDHRGQVRDHILKGERDGRYLIVDEGMLDHWPELFISPLGVVEKQSPDGVDVRVINDYSFPDEVSVNALTVRDDFPPISYNPPTDIAKRIHALRHRFPTTPVLLMLGDVSGAFRHVPMHADAVHMFCFRFDGYVVIDLSCGFGWCGSPAFYALAGSIINHMYASTAPTSEAPLDHSCFEGNVWCDDHTCVEVDTGNRCHDADVALRRAMLTVLGPSSINERKFTTWSTNGKALGLLWDTMSGTVSIPTIKLTKATTRINTLLATPQVTKTDVQKLLGVLRHVAVCFPSARAFYQRLQCFSNPFRGGRRAVPADVCDDLHWFRMVLHHPRRFNGISVDRFIGAVPTSSHVYMDASDTGLCVLHPDRREFIRHRFTTTEQAAITSDDRMYSINVRELQSAVLAALLWGPSWQNVRDSTQRVVCLHIDNMSAVAWTNRRSSRHPLAQLYLRLLSLAEFQYQFVFTAEHIRGEINTMADAGSRAWDETHTLWATWTNLSNGWSQIPLLPPFDNLSDVWASCCADTLWRSLPTPSTNDTGGSGVPSLTA